MFLIDSHCHIDILNYNSKLFNNIKEYVNFCKKKNILYILAVSIDLKSFLKIFRMSINIPNIGISCGIHPLYWKNNISIKKLFFLKKISLHKKVIAIGESGLDYKLSSFLNKKIQIKLFKFHLNIAKKNKKPIIIHSRFSFKDTYDIVSRFNILDFGGLVHCFSYIKKNELSKLLDIGLYISISGLVTFINAIDIQKIVKYIPLDRLLVETDSPYLSPHPFRGKFNDSTKILLIFKKISEIKCIDINDLIFINKKNFIALFKVNLNIKYLI